MQVHELLTGRTECISLRKSLGLAVQRGSLCVISYGVRWGGLVGRWFDGTVYDAPHEALVPLLEFLLLDCRCSIVQSMYACSYGGCHLHRVFFSNSASWSWLSFDCLLPMVTSYGCVRVCSSSGVNVLYSALSSSRMRCKRQCRWKAVCHFTQAKHLAGDTWRKQNTKE